MVNSLNTKVRVSGTGQSYFCGKDFLAVETDSLDKLLFLDLVTGEVKSARNICDDDKIIDSNGLFLIYDSQTKIMKDYSSENSEIIFEGELPKGFRRLNKINDGLIYSSNGHLYDTESKTFISQLDEFRRAKRRIQFRNHEYVICENERSTVAYSVDSLEELWRIDEWPYEVTDSYVYTRLGEVASDVKTIRIYNHAGELQCEKSFNNVDITVQFQMFGDAIVLGLKAYGTNTTDFAMVHPDNPDLMFIKNEKNFMGRFHAGENYHMMVQQLSNGAAVHVLDNNFNIIESKQVSHREFRIKNVYKDYFIATEGKDGDDHPEVWILTTDGQASNESVEEIKEPEYVIRSLIKGMMSVYVECQTYEDWHPSLFSEALITDMNDIDAFVYEGDPNDGQGSIQICRSRRS